MAAQFTSSLMGDIESFPLLQAALDAMSAHVAILDPQGVIVAVNAAWVRYGEQNGHDSPHKGIGVRYVDICRPAAGSCAEDAIAISAAVDRLLRSASPTRFQYDYLCPHPADPTRDRWFHLNLQSFRLKEETYIMMSHEDITERYVTERNRDLLSEALDQVLAGVIITDADGRILYANPGFCALTGYDPRDIIGRTPRFLRSARVPAATYKGLWETITGGKTWRGTLPNRRKNGQLYWTSETISPIVDPAGVITHFVAVQEDITESYRNARLHSGLIDSSSEAFLSIDRQGIIRDWSKKAEQMFGRSTLQAVGSSFPDMALSPDDADAFRQQLAAFHPDRPLRFGKPQRMTMHHGNHAAFPVDLTLVPVDLDGEWRFTGFARDMSEAVLAEQQLLQAQKMEAVGQLAGSMAHDFNNVLGIISGSLDLIRMELGEDHKYVNIAKEATTRAAQSVSSLMTVARKRAVDPVLVDVNKTFAELAPLLKQTAGRKIKLDISVADEMPGILVEPSALYNAIVNLVVNARDAMLPDGGSMIVYAYILWVDKTFSMPGLDLPDGQYLVIGVDDNGPGMTPEVAEKAFEPFFTTKAEGMGTGLGLSMVYQFTRRSGGLARINSRPGQGCNIHMLFPVPGDPLAGSSRAIPENAGIRVLIADPDQRFLASTVNRLQSHGYTTMTAPTSARATRLLAQQEFDVLVLDVAMPHGKELIEAAHSLTASDKLPIALVFTSSNPGAVPSRLAGKGTPVLQKPISRPETLLQGIERANQRRSLQ